MPTSTPASSSALGQALDQVGDRWTLLVVDALLDGPRRFGAIHEAVSGVATNVLADRLRRLEAGGLVLARPYSRRPPRFTYQLSGSGLELASTLRSLAAWGSRGGGGDPLVPATAAPLHHTSCGSAVEVRWHCLTCARLVDDDEIDELAWV
ncbi:MAG TPA: helix-turn-helix domain-containing protein [Acidimicrobiales bacterium]